MDPISAAIITTLSAGVVTGAGKAGENLLVDAYTALKDAIKKKFGGESDVAKAVDQLEAKPDSEGRQTTLKEEVVAVRAGEHADLLQLANAVLAQIRTPVSNAWVVQRIDNGSQNVQVAYGTATVTHGNALKE